MAYTTSGTYLGVAQPGLAVASGATFTDWLGGSYVVNSVDSLGRIQTMTQTVAPTASVSATPSYPYLELSSTAATGIGTPINWGNKEIFVLVRWS